MDVDLYRYYIGREDQSVNEKVMIGRIDQQIRVNKLMADAFHNCQFDSKHLKKYMLSYLDIITTVSSIMQSLTGTIRCEADWYTPEMICPCRLTPKAACTLLR